MIIKLVRECILLQLESGRAIINTQLVLARLQRLGMTLATMGKQYNRECWSLFFEFPALTTPFHSLLSSSRITSGCMGVMGTIGNRSCNGNLACQWNLDMTIGNDSCNCEECCKCFTDENTVGVLQIPANSCNSKAPDGVAIDFVNGGAGPFLYCC